MAATGELELKISEAMLGDRHRLARQLHAIEQASRTGKPYDRNLARLNAELERSIARRQARRAAVPAITFDDELPISAKRDEIARTISRHQVVIVCGETGSGKSTQLPKICLELGRGVDGLIGHTQPRRIAARSVAARIAEELNSPLGQAVGFKVRFTDVTSPNTFIKLMTDGILLAESQHDRYLNRYDTLILDEAHERSLNIDFLLGYLKRLLPSRPDLKLIVTSATIDAERFSQHFAAAAGPAPVIQVSGRTYPVEVRHRPVEPDEETGEIDVERGVLDAVNELARIGRGDMLLFMPTEQAIHAMAKALRGHKIPGDSPGRTTEVVPLYARLSTADQQRVFQSHPHRRIVIATNVAESSLTVPGIRFVIDPGTARISRYSARSKVQRLPIEPVSQASADQRKGRCGRVGPGICVRLFSEEDYQSRERFTAPEIQRTNLAAVILQTKALRFGEIEDFPFLDPPRPDAIRDGYRTLFELGAIDERHELTEIGRQLGRIPVDPRIGRVVLAAQQENCLNEVLIIASALEVQDPRERPLEKQQAADEAHVRFAHEESDFLSYLKLWDFFHQLKGELSRNQLRKACRQNFLSYNRMLEWMDVHRQLLQLVEEAKFKPQARRDDYAAIHRALLTGFLSSVAFRSETHEYTVAGGGKANLWPGSAVFSAKPKWIVAAEVVETTRRYVRTVARINPAWIEPVGDHMLNRSYSDPHWDRASGSALAFEKVSLMGLTIVARRRVRYGPVKPAAARELLIQHGLVEGEFDTRGPFLAHNLALLEEMEQLQAKVRRGDLLLGEEARYEFYDRRIPADCYDGPRLEKWRREAERKEPKLLFMSRRDLVRDDEVRSPADFPDTLSIREMRLPLEYRLEPGTEHDGITITVPKEGLHQLDPQRLGWLVPGLMEQKIIALIKSLPKPIRRNFVPVPETAKRVMRELRFGEGSLNASVAEVLGRISGSVVPASAFEESKLPDHLRINVRVIDAGGETLANSRDLGQLRAEFAAAAVAELETVVDPLWRRDRIMAWDFGDLPEQIELERGGMTLRAFPALLDQGESASLRLLDSPEHAARATRGGLLRLFAIAANRELRGQVAWLPQMDELRLLARSLPAVQPLEQQLVELIAARAFLDGQAVPRSEPEFRLQLKTGRARLGGAVHDVANLIAPLLEAHHQLQLALQAARPPQWRYVIEDIGEQLAHLIRPRFLVETPWEWLQHYPRYVGAMRLRLDKLAGPGLARDQRNFQQLEPFWRRYTELAERHAEQGTVDGELEQFGWMLEEFRVSLFAQELGTAISVSAKRLEQQWLRVDG